MGVELFREETGGCVYPPPVGKAVGASHPRWEGKARVLPGPSILQAA